MTARLRDVAERAGVSISTVSRMLSDDTARPVASVTQKRIREAMRAVNYEPKQGSKRPMRRVGKYGRRTHRVGLVLGPPVSKFSDPFLPRILDGVYRELSRLHCLLQFTHILHELEEEDYHALLSRDKVDGLIFAGELSPADHIIDVERSVVIELGGDQLRRSGHVQTDIIATEKRSAMYQLVDHLVAQGRCRMAFLGPSPEEDERGEAFMHALARHGLSVEPAWYRHAAWTTDRAYPVALDFVEKQGRDVDTIVCANDMIAIAALRAVKERGLSVPGDIAITGFDDFAFARDLDPPLTTVHLPLDLMGRLAARKVIERLEHPDWPPIIHVVPTTLVVRVSSGATAIKAIGAPYSVATPGAPESYLDRASGLSR